ncbi:MAG: PAS domain S-box protein [Vulcanimicrobiota bacterium]
MKTRKAPSLPREKDVQNLKSLTAMQTSESSEEMARILFELQIHQVELEAQNTELKNAQITIEESRDIFCDFYDFSPIAYFTLDERGIVIEANLTAALWTGMERSMLVNKPLAAFIHHSSFTQFFSHLKRVFSEKGKETCELLITPWKKAPFFVHMESIFHQRTNSSHECRASLIDITERKKAEEDSKKAKLQIQAILDNIPDMVWLKDREGRILSVNKAFERVCGGASHLLVSRTDGDICPHLLAESLLANDREMIVSGEQTQVEETIMDSEGKMRWLETIRSPVYDDRHEIIGTTGISRDITKRHITENALNESESKFRRLIENIKEGIWVVDREMNTTFVNQRMETLLGWTVEEMMGRNLMEFMDGQAREVCVKLFERRRQGIAEQHDLEFMRKDGQRIYALMETTPLIDEEGEFAGAVAGLTDITARKMAEDNLRKSREELRLLSSHLQKVREEERTSMAREIHDELGQVLTSLKLDLSWLLGRIQDRDKELLSRTADMQIDINSAIDTVHTIITRLRPVILDDFGLMAALIWLVGEFQSHSGISCDFSFSSEEIVLPDECSTALFRICQESLTNVARHSDATGVKVTLRESDDNVILAIEDNGKGITEISSSRLSSLGLLGMRERAFALGGRVTFESGEGNGTKVEATFPLIRRDSYAASTDSR